jgi:hypothetical protein
MKLNRPGKVRYSSKADFEKEEAIGDFVVN